MKIVALVPVKNEEWYLPTYLSSVRPIADEIIALDDLSVDSSRRILLDAGAIVKEAPDRKENPPHMSYLRALLLEEGRKRGGTHFIWLDADEVFSGDFLKEARRTIGTLTPGQKLVMKWVSLWESTRFFRDDEGSAIWTENFKDFVVCDSPKIDFEDRFLSEGRTPGRNEGNAARLDPRKGVVMHFQYISQEHLQIKQAWYRCSELIRNPSRSLDINATYSFTLPGAPQKLSSVPDKWLAGLVLPTLPPPTSQWRLAQMSKWFDELGVEFFEPLEIWHIPELRAELLRRTGRAPQRVSAGSFLTKIKREALARARRVMPPQLKRFLKGIARAK